MKLHRLLGTIFLSSFGIIYLAGCDGKQITLKPSEEGGSVMEVSGEEISFASIKPLFNNYCVECHKANGMPDISDYEKAKSNASTIRSYVSSGFMPQQGSEEAQAITDEERAKIIRWVNAGAPLDPIVSDEKDSSMNMAELQPQLPHTLETINQCMNCHGNNGISSSPSNPNLAGQNKMYLKNQLKYFRSGQRVNKTMNGIAKDLSDAEIEILASFFASLQPTEKNQQEILAETYIQIYEAKNKPAGIMTCVGCHANPTYGGLPLKAKDNPEGLPYPVPSISGQKPEYIVTQFKKYYSDERKNPIMNQIAKQDIFIDQKTGELNIKLINDIAEYFNKIPAQNVNK